MKISTYVLNLDRHPDRLAAISSQLDAQGMQWARFSALDASKITQGELDNLVAKTGPIPRMPDGARACTAGHILILRKFLESDSTHVLVLEDDAVLSEKLAVELPGIIESMGKGILNISRQVPSGDSKKLVVKLADERTWGDFSMPELVGIHYSCAGYVVDRESAETLLALNPYPNMPIDHIFFNPNVSNLGKFVPVRQLFPALVRPRETLTSSIQNVAVKGSDSVANKLKRARAEVSIAPRLLLGLLFGKYKIRQLDFED